MCLLCVPREQMVGTMPRTLRHRTPPPCRQSPQQRIAQVEVPEPEPPPRPVTRHALRLYEGIQAVQPVASVKAQEVTGPLRVDESTRELAEMLRHIDARHHAAAAR